MAMVSGRKPVRALGQASGLVEVLAQLSRLIVDEVNDHEHHHQRFERACEGMCLAFGIAVEVALHTTSWDLAMQS